MSMSHSAAISNFLNNVHLQSLTGDIHFVLIMALVIHSDKKFEASVFESFTVANLPY